MRAKRGGQRAVEAVVLHERREVEVPMAHGKFVLAEHVARKGLQKRQRKLGRHSGDAGCGRMQFDRQLIDAREEGRG